MLLARQSRRQHPQPSSSTCFRRHAVHRRRHRWRPRHPCLTGRTWIDPALSPWPSPRSSSGRPDRHRARRPLNILLEGTPAASPSTRFAPPRPKIEGRSGEYVHDLHVWSLGSNTHASPATSSSPTSRPPRATHPRPHQKLVARPIPHPPHHPAVRCTWIAEGRAGLPVFSLEETEPLSPPRHGTLTIPAPPAPVDSILKPT